MSTKIIICDVCQGWGRIEKNELTDYHHREREYWEVVCTRCKGHGRLVKEKMNRAIVSNDVIRDVNITIRSLRQDELKIRGKGDI